MEMMCLCKELTPLVIGQSQEVEDHRPQIFTQKPCLGMDTHFSGAHVDTYIGKEGYKAIHTRQQGRLYKGLKKYYHLLKGVEIGTRSRARPLSRQ